MFGMFSNKKENLKKIEEMISSFTDDKISINSKIDNLKDDIMKELNKKNDIQFQNIRNLLEEYNFIPHNDELQENFLSRIKEILVSSYEKVENKLQEKDVDISDLKNKYSSINVDKWYCINLDERSNRWEKVSKQFKRFNLPVTRFSALKGSEDDYNPDSKTVGQLGVIKSHIEIIESAKKKGYKQIAIFEDDITLCEDFWYRLDDFSNKIPDNWKVAYLGATIFNEKVDIEPVKPNIYSNKTSYGCFSMIIKSDIFDELLDLYKTFLYNADNLYAEVIQKKYPTYTYVPFFCYVNKEISDTDTKNGLQLMDDFLFNIIYRFYEKSIISEETIEMPILESSSKTDNTIKIENHVNNHKEKIVYVDSNKLPLTVIAKKIEYPVVDRCFELSGEDLYDGDIQTFSKSGDIISNLMKTLKDVQDEYVLVMSTSTCFLRKIDKKYVEGIFKTMSNNNLPFLLLNNQKSKELGRFKEEHGILIENYSLDTPTIWKTDELRKVLKVNESSGNFESRITKDFGKKLPAINVNFIINITNNGMLNYHGNTINSYYVTKINNIK